MKKADMIFIGILIIAIIGTGLWFLLQSPRNILTIESDGEIIFSGHISQIEDGKTWNVSYGEGYNIIHYHSGKVWVEEADCPDQICVNQGEITGKGVIACVPHRLIVALE